MKTARSYLLVIGCILATFCSSTRATATQIERGQTLTGTIGSAAQIGVYTFTASAGDVVDLTMTSTSGTLSPTIQLYNPVGTLISSANANGGDCGSPATEMNTVMLTAPGTYTVDVSDCSSSNTGSYALYFQIINSPGGAVTLSFGETSAGTIGLAAQSNTYTFSANAGDLVDFTLGTTSGSLSPKIRLYNSSGTLNKSANSNGGDCGSPTTEMNTVTLPSTGTYTVLIGDCGDSNTGNYEIYAQRTDNPGPPVVPLLFGQAQAGMISSAAQNNSYTFSANDGDLIIFTLAATSGSLSPKIRLYNPDGTLNNSANSNGGDCGSPTAEMNTIALPTTGTYTVLVGDCSDTNTGNYEIYSQRTNDPSGSVNLALGQTPTGLIGSAAQSDTYTFSANAGDLIVFTLAATSGSLSPEIQLYNPSGTLNSSANSNGGDCGSPTTEMNTIALPTTGTYTVLVGDCSDMNSGNYAIYAQRINNPSGAVSVLWEQPQAGTIGSAAQSNTYTFVGSAANVVDFTATETTGILSPKIRLYNPDGSLLSSANSNGGDCGSPTTEMSSVTLAQNGTYTVLLGDCGDTNTGNYSFSSQCFGTCPLPAPSLASISPTSALAGGGGITLTVNGANFVDVVSNSEVEWNGTALTTAWVSTTQMTAAVPAADIATAGSFPVTVYTPAPGGGTSSAISFAVNNPVPALTSILPISATVGGSAFILTVNGSNFIQGSSVQWNSSSLVTTFVSAIQLTAQVPAADFTTSGTASVTVFNATPGGGTSTAQTFTINPISLPPSLTAITIFGTGYVSGGPGLAPVGTVDGNFKLLSCPAGTCANEPYVTLTGGYPFPPWLANTSSAQWIGPDSGGNESTIDSPGLYDYEETFDLAGFDIITVTLSGSFATDNSGYIQLNGVTVGPTSTSASTLTPFTLTSGFQQGINKLDFLVTNGPTGGAQNPTGLFVELSGTGVQTSNPTPKIAWPIPVPITYGTPLSATQLNASSTVGGTFVYTPNLGTVLHAGSQTLSVTFTPTDTNDYTTATATVTLIVNQATPAIAWATPGAITYGTALSVSQLDASSTVAGTFTYIPASGSVLKAGTQTLSVTFTPTDTTDYTTATATVQLNVNQATPAIVWPTPADITNGTALSATQLDASSAVAGTFVYTPAAGTVLATGTQTLSVTFTPTDATDYTTAVATVQLNVTNITVSGKAVTVSSPGATTGNTSTISVTPVSGFTGSVALTAAITSSPAGAQDLPTLSFGSTTPVVISGASAGTATLTITSTAATSAVLVHPKLPGVPWYAAGGATLACLLLFGIPARRRRWQTILGMVVLFVALTSGVVACGGGGSRGGGGTGNPGTTAGAYTVTVTGTSGTIAATGTLTLTVQ
jgi:hypothetical protein